MPTFQIKRIYEPADTSDGKRILVDRLWPRGVKKENAQLDAWLKEVAPTTNLRKWFDHDPAKWDEFQLKYLLELKHNQAVKDLSRSLANDKTITLLYAAKDTQHTHALVLQRFLKEMSP
jgi:uncharacterized protein YeaO (DUF488 family)